MESKNTATNPANKSSLFQEMFVLGEYTLTQNIDIAAKFQQKARKNILASLVWFVKSKESFWPVRERRRGPGRTKAGRDRSSQAGGRWKRPRRRRRRRRRRQTTSAHALSSYSRGGAPFFMAPLLPPAQSLQPPPPGASFPPTVPPLNGR
ncbi:uncharacterized protein LOC144616066 [Panthera onca]